MSEVDELLSEACLSLNGKHVFCSWYLARKDAPPLMAEFMDRAESTPGITKAGIMRVLKTRFNLPLSRSGVSRHLNKECKCQTR